MEKLDDKYLSELKVIKEAIQSSEILTRFLDEEEEEVYVELKNAFEPGIDEIFRRVAAERPMQMIAFEKELLEDGYEGLYLPKVLGYSVLRGELNDNCKYFRPQDHFKEVLLKIANSPNFDIIKQRIGQSIEVGFAMSSDIYNTNLINSIDNKKVRYFLEGLIKNKYRDIRDRKTAYTKYAKQFESINYRAADFPQKVSELKLLFPGVKSFLHYRLNNKMENSSLMPHLMQMVQNEKLHGQAEHVHLLGLIGKYIELNQDEKGTLAVLLNKQRREDEFFQVKYFKFLESLLGSDLPVDDVADNRISFLLDKTIEDDITNFYGLMDIIHSKGYIHEEAIEAVKVFYNQYEGLSTINGCLRLRIFGYFKRLIENLTVEEYHEYFELNKIFTTYMEIFDNQKFNQEVKDLCMKYVKKLIKKYTDKRGKDYQDIKKFVATNFLDMGFLTSKQIVELFKTKRKRKPSS